MLPKLDSAHIDQQILIGHKRKIKDITSCPPLQQNEDPRPYRKTPKMTVFQFHKYVVSSPRNLIKNAEAKFCHGKGEAPRHLLRHFLSWQNKSTEHFHVLPWQYHSPTTAFPCFRAMALPIQVASISA